MKILLADDERMVRLGLKSMLEELYPDEHAYLQARNGKETVELVASQRPDVVILDIKMPLLDGIGVLSQCRELSPSTVWIILSGHASFEYARQSIALNVFEYLVKPVDIHALKSVFSRICESRIKQRQDNNIIFSYNVIHNLTAIGSQGEEGDVQTAMKDSDYIFYRFYIDPLSPAPPDDAKDALRSSIDRFCSNYPQVVNHTLFYDQRSDLCLVCDIADATWLTHFLEEACKGLSPHMCSVFWGNSHMMQGIRQIMRRIDGMRSLCLVKDCRRPMFIKNLEALASVRLLLSFADSLDALACHYRKKDREKFTALSGGLKCSKDSHAAFRLADCAVLQKHISLLLGREVSFHCLNELLDVLAASFSELEPDMDAEVRKIDQIKAYIDGHYAQDVSLPAVSAIFRLSPSYLSKVFHEKNGQKYIDYVTAVRIENAVKTITSHPQLPVKQVSEMVGYTSVRHFSRVFKKITGCFPSDYPTFSNPR